MEKNLKESLSAFVVDVLLLQRTIREKSPVFQTLKQHLIQAVTSCEASYLGLKKTRSEVDFNDKISVCLGEIREANYWLRILREAQIGDLVQENLLIDESLRLRAHLESLSWQLERPVLRINTVAA